MVFGHHADVSPDGSRLVYATCEWTHWSGEIGRYEIAMVGVDGTGRQRLTNSKSFENYPVWSPNGDRIAFVAHYPDNMPNDYGDGHYEPSETRIFTMAASGTDVKVVPNTKGVGLYPPVWSPDGERLAFTVNEEWDYHSRRERRILYTIRVDGSELSRIGEVSTLPTWSPDGERLAFGFNAPIDGSDAFDSGVHTVRFDGSDARRIVTQPVSWTQRVNQMSWFPDGSGLLIASDRLFAVRPDSSDQRELGPPTLHWGIGPIPRDIAAYPGGVGAISNAFVGPITDATWSPDGSMIAVRQWNETHDFPGSPYVILVVTRDGAYVTTVAEGGHDWIRPFSAACSAGTVVPEPETNSGLVEDCEALARVRNAFGPYALYDWNPETPLADWPGVEVSGDPPRVRKLVLEGRVLAGPIPPDIAVLGMLEVLDLSGNDLTGPIPPELGKLILLKGLGLSANNLTGPIPPELGKLAMLESLSLEGNELSGCVPVEFPDLWVRRSDLARCEQ